MFQQSFTKNTALPYYTYDQRGLLRNWSPQDGTTVLVDSLGLFVYSNSNSQILDNNNVNTYQVQDDDESCFQTSTGAWLLEYPHWDVVNGWYLPDIEALYTATYSPATAAPRFPGRIIFYSSANSISSVSASSNATQVFGISGVAPTDRVIVNPSIGVLTTGNIQPAIYAYCNASNFVTLVLSNMSTSALSITATFNWYVTVIKQSSTT